MSRAILFDRDQVDHLGDLSERPRRLKGSKLLWVDIDREDIRGVEEVAASFGLDDATRERLAASGNKAVFQDHGRHIHVTTYSPCAAGNEDQMDLVPLECVVGESWVITAHDQPSRGSR